MKTPKQIKQSEAMKRKWAERKLCNKQVIQKDITNTPDAELTLKENSGSSAEPSGVQTRTLSNKIFHCNVSVGFDENYQEVIFAKEVKEFIKLLKEQIQYYDENGISETETAFLHSKIDKLAGKTLTE